MQAIKGEIFEVRSDLIKWIEDKPVAVRAQAKFIIMNLAIASRGGESSVADLLADQVEQLRAMVAEKRWHWRRR